MINDKNNKRNDTKVNKNEASRHTHDNLSKYLDECIDIFLANGGDKDLKEYYDKTWADYEKELAKAKENVDKKFNHEHMWK